MRKALLGHSDADVLTHALMDALLGAAALGDIGGLFRIMTYSYLGADSIELLKTVVRLLCDKGYGIVNADCTVIAQRPKLKAYIESMRKVLASAMGVELDAVSVKATTEEHLGFTGRGTRHCRARSCTNKLILSGSFSGCLIILTVKPHGA